MDRLVIVRRRVCAENADKRCEARCAAHNAAVGGKPDSAHLLGEAVDVAVSGADALRLLGNSFEARVSLDLVWLRKEVYGIFTWILRYQTESELGLIYGPTDKGFLTWDLTDDQDTKILARSTIRLAVVKEVQSPYPEPCCVSHVTRLFEPRSVSLRPATSRRRAGPFPLTFIDPCAADIPIDYNQVFFWHIATAGLMHIISFNGTSFMVSLVDQQRAGAGIKSGECVLVTVQPTALAGSNTNSAVSLSGNFIAPANGQSRVMYILNGTAIPTGATVTITWQGQIGSYVVVNYVGAQGNIYAYNVQNTGSGLTPRSHCRRRWR